MTRIEPSSSGEPLPQAVGARGPRYQCSRSPRVPSGDDRGGGEVGENLLTKYRQRSRSSLTARKSAAGDSTRAHKPRGERRKSAANGRALPPGGSCRARRPEGDGREEHRRPTQGTDRAGTEQGRPIREPAAERMAKEGTAGAASGRGARQRAQVPERISRGDRPGPGADLGAMRRIGTATAAAGAARRSGRSTRNAGESRTRSAHKARRTAGGTTGPARSRALPQMFCADRLKCREHRTTGCGIPPAGKGNKRQLGERSERTADARGGDGPRTGPLHRHSVYCPLQCSGGTTQAERAARAAFCERSELFFSISCAVSSHIQGVTLNM